MGLLDKLMSVGKSDRQKRITFLEDALDKNQNDEKYREELIGLCIQEAVEAAQNQGIYSEKAAKALKSSLLRGIIPYKRFLEFVEGYKKLGKHGEIFDYAELMLIRVRAECAKPETKRSRRVISFYAAFCQREGIMIDESVQEYVPTFGEYTGRWNDALLAIIRKDEEERKAPLLKPA
jgi:hypothetical protein